MILINKTFVKTVEWVQNERNFGVFASTKLQKGDVIEICPFVIINNYDNVNDFYSFIVYDDDKMYFVNVLGYGMSYNHRNIPNVHWTFSLKQKTITFYALDDIEANEELFINYKIEKNYQKDGFCLKEALKIVSFEAYKNLTFEVDITDIENFIKD